jgi:hypothetical protein
LLWPIVWEGFPAPEEFSRYDDLLQAFGSFTRIERLTLRLVDRETFEGSRDQRRQDLLTYLAMLRLQGLPSPKFSDLPPSLRNDVRGYGERPAVPLLKVRRSFSPWGSQIKLELSATLRPLENYYLTIYMCTAPQKMICRRCFD